MHIHHKNMKYLCAISEAWVQKNLGHLGIVGFCCNFIDLKHNTYLPLTDYYDLYCEFMEKKHHLNMPSRMQSGLRHWSAADPLHQLEHQFGASNASVHMFDWTLKTEHSLELFCIVSRKLLQPHQIYELKQWMHVFSYQATQVKKYKPRAQIELQNRETYLEKHRTFEDVKAPQPFQFQKAQFDQLVLTGKEQEYIQHLVFQRTYKDIAQRNQVSEVAVRKVIYNIKCKLGCPTMPIAEMFTKLHACGALGACMQSVYTL